GRAGQVGGADGPGPHPRRQVLRALDSGRVDGADFFTRLFRGVPAERLLRFLDGSSQIHEDLLIGLRTPVVPMLRTVVGLPFTARREPPPFPPPPPPTGHQESTP
ncbi:lycopene cyclase family protein, partial [Streptomyces microflavus]|uniref:lycopene cyclase family protein n=1 Tax=Streptomyces microflavus TaxID=1919 RepID=UPI0033A98840